MTVQTSARQRSATFLFLMKNVRHSGLVAMNRQRISMSKTAVITRSTFTGHCWISERTNKEGQGKHLQNSLRRDSGVVTVLTPWTPTLAAARSAKTQSTLS